MLFYFILPESKEVGYKFGTDKHNFIVTMIWPNYTFQVETLLPVLLLDSS